MSKLYTGDINDLVEEVEKAIGVPKGVDPEKHERCVKDVKKQGHDKSSAYAICNASMKKSDTIKTPKDEMVEEHKRLIGVLESDSHKDDKKEAKKQKKELKGYMKKSTDANLIYKSEKPYSEDLNDLVEETLEKGGPGSGKRGHTSTALNIAAAKEAKEHHKKKRDEYLSQGNDAKADYHHDKYLAAYREMKGYEKK